MRSGADALRWTKAKSAVSVGRNAARGAGSRSNACCAIYRRICRSTDQDGTYGQVIGKRTLRVLLVFKETVLAVEDVREVRSRVTIVLREPEIYISASVDTSEQVRFVEAFSRWAREVDVAVNPKCLAMSSVNRAVLERTTSKGRGRSSAQRGRSKCGDVRRSSGNCR